MVLKSTRALTIPHAITLQTDIRELEKQKRSVERQQDEVRRTLDKYEQTRNIVIPTTTINSGIQSTRQNSFDKRFKTEGSYNYADKVKTAKSKVLIKSIR